MFWGHYQASGYRKWPTNSLLQKYTQFLASGTLESPYDGWLLFSTISQSGIPSWAQICYTSQSRNLELLLLPHQSLNGRQGTPHLAYAVLGFKPKLCATDGHPKTTLQSISPQHLQTPSFPCDSNPSLSICKAAHLYVQFNRTLFFSLSFPFASYYFILSANFTILEFIKIVSNSLPPAVLCLIVSNKVLTLLGFSCCGVATREDHRDMGLRQ